jgi:NTE family protein
MSAILRDLNKRVDLVFEGGGVKGNALAGALSVLEENGFRPQNIAGASAGAIIATLLAAGYTARELHQFVSNQDFKLFMDKGWEDRLPGFIGVPLSILHDRGIYEGVYFLERMQELLAKKGVSTFRDLVHPEYADQPKYRYKVQVIVSDLTSRRLLVLPRDAQVLGVQPDELNVALAVRMSMSYPFFFEPVPFRNPQTGHEHLLVDGGMLSNFPVWLFDSEGIPEWPTFGLPLVEDDLRVSVGNRLSSFDGARKIVGPVGPFLLNLVSTLLEAHDRMYIETADFARTITVPTLGVSTLDFNLSAEKTQALFGWTPHLQKRGARVRQQKSSRLNRELYAQCGSDWSDGHGLLSGCRCTLWFSEGERHQVIVQRLILIRQQAIHNHPSIN